MNVNTVCHTRRENVDPTPTVRFNVDPVRSRYVVDRNTRIEEGTRVVRGRAVGPKGIAHPGPYVPGFVLSTQRKNRWFRSPFFPENLGCLSRHLVILFLCGSAITGSGILPL